MEYADERTLALTHAAHRVSSAEKAFIRKLLEETSALRRAIHRSKDKHGKTPFNKAQKAIAIARAAEETVIAEKKLAAVRVLEAELRLKTAREGLQAADSKLRAAEQQVTHILSTMRTQGHLPSSPVDSEPDNHHAHHNDPISEPDSDEVNDDMSGLSVFDSYYDAPSSFVTNDLSC
jgi:hypothetical protein